MRAERRRRGRTTGTREIGIGDVLYSWRATAAVGAVERRDVAAALGFTYLQLAPSATAPSPSRASVPSGTREGAIGQLPLPSMSRGDAAQPDLRHHSAESEPERLSLHFELMPTGKPQSAPRWATISEVVPSDQRAHLWPETQLEPLLTPGWTRNALAALCATHVDEGSIDLERLIDAVCLRRPLVGLPRESVRTLRRGVQLLIDENDGFAFHRRDVDQVVRSLSAVVGSDRTEVLRFSGSPSHGVRPNRFAAPKVWRPPAPGTPIVVVSDFGLVRTSRIQRSSSPDDWKGITAMARSAGCTVVGLVPFAPTRWPISLRQAIRLLRWDRRTTAALAQRVARGEMR